MIAGLAAQVLSLGIFMGCWLHFLLQLKKADESMRNSRFASLRSTQKFKLFNYG
jgi:hypothetical protein